MDLKDFVVNFCLDRGFQPKELVTIEIKTNKIVYRYVQNNKRATVEESIKWDF